MNKLEREGEICRLNSFKRVNGITLIALVITILVVRLVTAAATDRALRTPAILPALHFM